MSELKLLVLLKGDNEKKEGKDDLKNKEKNFGLCWWGFERKENLKRKNKTKEKGGNTRTIAH